MQAKTKPGKKSNNKLQPQSSAEFNDSNPNSGKMSNRMKDRIKPRPANAIKVDEAKVVDKEPGGEKEKKDETTPV